MNSLFNLRPLYCCHHHQHHHHKTYVFAVSQQSIVVLRRYLSTSQLKKHYTLLNCTKDSTVKEIKESFLRLSKIYHPDNKDTGSHQKFVQLKEAYDAVKDGPPTIANDGGQYYRQQYSQASNNSYSNYTDWSNLKQSYNRHNDPFSRRPFGEPYGRSSTPWEDMMREREARRRRDEEIRFAHRRSGTISGTLFLGAIAWIVIYSCVMLGWDSNFSPGSMTAEEFRRRSQIDYQEYEEKRRRRAFYDELDRKKKRMMEMQKVEETKKGSSSQSLSPEPVASSDSNSPSANYSNLHSETEISKGDNIQLDPVVR